MHGLCILFCEKLAHNTLIVLVYTVSTQWPNFDATITVVTTERNDNKAKQDKTILIFS